MKTEAWTITLMLFPRIYDHVADGRGRKPVAVISSTSGSSSSRRRSSRRRSRRRRSSRRRSSSVAVEHRRFFVAACTSLPESTIGALIISYNVAS